MKQLVCWRNDWESTIPYYRLINEGIKQRLGGLHLCAVLLHSVDFMK